VTSDGEGLPAVLETRNDIEVPGLQCRLQGALQLAEQAKPQIVVLDNGDDRRGPAVATLVERTPEVQVVGLGVPDVDAAMVACAEAGAAASTCRL
jgi:DNA-binding NarL/FixJ family response regulator